MQIFVTGLCLLLLEVLHISGVPHNYDYRYRRSPHRAVMLSGYYGRPSQAEYNPEGAMTAFISGDTLATNSFLGGKYRPVLEPDEIEIPGEENINNDAPPTVLSPVDSSEGQTDEVNQDVSDRNLEVPVKRNPKRKPVVKPPVEADEEEEEEGSWPFQSGGKRGPSYTAFFPIMFGGYKGLNGRDSGSGGYPGSATAIANSFSTGRGGVASSHATAYGDPYVSSLLKSGFNGKKKPLQKEE